MVSKKVSKGKVAKSKAKPVKKAPVKSKKVVAKTKKTIVKKKTSPKKTTVIKKPSGKAKNPLSKKAKMTKKPMAKKAKAKKVVAKKKAAPKKTIKKKLTLKTKVKPKPKAKVKAKKTSVKKVVKKVVKKAIKVVKKPIKAVKKQVKSIKTNKPLIQSKVKKEKTMNAPFNQTLLKESMNYMTPSNLAHFHQLLLKWKDDLMAGVDKTIDHMKDEAGSLPDPNDRATQEEAFSFELRTRDRERKLIKKIDEALERIEDGDYGYCLECGIEIGLERLEARPTATLCIDCKTLDEIREKQVAE